ncbi:MAG: PD-(D/E)XK nuclease family protein [Myxococcota bacterium]|nr:PD-(D/E)XK nuclease family protein [Myxococcota bacterium]
MTWFLPGRAVPGPPERSARLRPRRACTPRLGGRSGRNRCAIVRAGAQPPRAVGGPTSRVPLSHRPGDRAPSGRANREGSLGHRLQPFASVELRELSPAVPLSLHRETSGRDRVDRGVRRQARARSARAPAPVRRSRPGSVARQGGGAFSCGLGATLRCLARPHRARGEPPASYLELGTRCLSNYYRRHYPFDHGETLSIEARVAFPLDPAGRYRIQGFVDRIVRAPDGAVEIHDYKTGRWVPSQAKLDSDRQLALYQLGFEARHGRDASVRLVWHFLQRDQVRVSTRTREQLDTLCGQTIALIDRIEAEREFAPKPSALCSWCEHNDVCPAMATTTAAAKAGAAPVPAPSAALTTATAPVPPAATRTPASTSTSSSSPARAPARELVRDPRPGPATGSAEAPPVESQLRLL